MYKRLKKLYPNSNEGDIQKALQHIEDSEALISISYDLREHELTDEEIRMYYNQAVNGIL